MRKYEKKQLALQKEQFDKNRGYQNWELTKKDSDAERRQLDSKKTQLTWGMIASIIAIYISKTTHSHWTNLFFVASIVIGFFTYGCILVSHFFATEKAGHYFKCTNPMRQNQEYKDEECCIEILYSKGVSYFNRISTTFIVVNILLMVIFLYFTIWSF